MTTASSAGFQSVFRPSSSHFRADGLRNRSLRGSAGRLNAFRNKRTLSKTTSPDMKKHSTPVFAKRLLPAAALALSSLLASLISASAQTTIKLYEVARFDLSATANATNSATYIGDNPLAVGWNGSKLYVAGLRGSPGTGNSTAIIEVANAAGASGFVTPTYSSAFGVLATPSGRGYTGLAMKGNQLAASFDIGSNSINGIQMFNASTNTLTWNLTATGNSSANVGTTRGMVGPDFDPGYNGDAGSGSGLGWNTQGSGRRLLNNSTSGATIYSNTANVPVGATPGGVINTNPVSTTWRDMAFNPATGDIYMRNQFGVTRANRTSANTFVGPTSNTANQSDQIYLNAGNATSNVVGINIGFMDSVNASGSNPYSGDLLVFNDRGSTADGQSWTNVIKFTTTSGSAVAAVYAFLSDPATSRAIYDFEWDATTQTLAVLDSTNLSVSIFATVPPVVATISVAPSSLGNFTATFGTASVSQSFTVNGTGLTANITATAPVGFEISTNNSSFSSSLELPESGGNVTDSSLYARITASAPTGSLSGNITLASTSATTQIVALSGTVGSTATLATLAATTTSSSIRTTTATLGGEVTADGGAAITARGVVYSLTATDSDPQVGASGVTNLPVTGTTGVFSVNATALTPGAAYSFKAYATNSAGTSYSAAGTFTALRPVEGWRLSNFGDVANSGTGANSASAAGDGIPNLVKYALCLDPAQWGGLPQPEIGNNRLKMSFQRDPARSDITITVEGTSDLLNAPWVPVATSTAGGAFSGNGSVSETPLQGGLQQVEVSDSVDTLTDPRRRFLRIRTTLPAE
jgi:hypothetical protein